MCLMDSFRGGHCTLSEWQCSRETAEFSCKTRGISGEGELLSASFQAGCPWYGYSWNNYLTCIFFKALTNTYHAGPQMSPDSPFSTKISPSVTSSSWHSFANPVKKGGTAGRIYYHGVWHLDLPSAGHAKPGQSHTAVNPRQKLFSSVKNSAL